MESLSKKGKRWSNWRDSESSTVETPFGARHS